MLLISFRNMELTTLKQNGRRLRLLVAIASYGSKNIEFLKRIIGNYQGMDMEVAIFVLSEAWKDLGPDVKLVVGLPSKNPWSLPFAHKRVFADNVDRYDLFAYSEDDMEVTEENIHAFLRVTPELKHDEIAGFLRYETDEAGIPSFPEAHGSYHWKAETVARRGPYTIAEFSNEHAAFYILTQDQLRRAIASGGYLRSPYEGRYDMLCAAATDPYTSCGFRKVICISTLQDFLIHHLPNRYVGQLGLPINAFTEQIETLIDIRDGVRPGTSLCKMESRILHGRWSKSYYEEPCAEVLTIVPRDAKAILSVGCGWGATEVELKKRGAKVTALPLDSVIGVTAARAGIEVIYGQLEECLENLSERKFDCVLMINLLHLLPDPWSMLQKYARLLANGGTLVIAGSNFDFLPDLVRRLLCIGDHRKLGDFDRSGINACGISTVKKQMEYAGFRVVSLRWFNHGRPLANGSLRSWPGRIMKRNWMIQACREGLA
jgi:SAM-dependent methyltransferase